MQLFNKDMQVVSSINKAAVGGRVMGMFGYAGDYIATNIIRFAPGLNNKLFMNVVNFDLRAADSSENGLFRSVLNSTMQPIMTAFYIKALSPDSSEYVIDVTDYL